MPRSAPQLLATLVALVTAIACSREAGKPLAVLGHQTIREADFEQYLASAYPPDRVAELRRDASARQRALDEYLDDLAIVAKARQQGIDQEPRFKKAAELMEIKTLAHLMTERHRDEIVRRTQVSPEEVQRYYEEHLDELTNQPRFTARQLLVYVKGNPAFPDQGLGDADARRKAKAALGRLRAGRSWDEVAKRYSDDLGTNLKGGLIRDGQFGYLAPEVEQAVRTQALGKPGEVMRSMFGYHVVQVEDRITEKTPEPFEKVRAMLTDRLAQAHSAEAGKAFMEPLAQAAGFKLTEAGKRDAFLLDEQAFAPDEILAEVAGKKIREADFRWFLKDALLPKQRAAAYSRAGARASMLSSFLDMLVLEAAARREGLDRIPELVRGRVLREQGLLAEFMQGRDKAGPFCECQQTDEERQLARREYFARVRAEVGLKLLASRS